MPNQAPVAIMRPPTVVPSTGRVPRPETGARPSGHLPVPLVPLTPGVPGTGRASLPGARVRTSRPCKALVASDTQLSVPPSIAEEFALTKRRLEQYQDALSAAERTITTKDEELEQANTRAYNEGRANVKGREMLKRKENECNMLKTALEEWKTRFGERDQSKQT